MAKLTRTQKYAELRDSLSQDKESSLSTQELSKYEDRLNNVTETLKPTPAPAPVNTPVQQPKPAVNNYQWTEFQETPISVNNIPKMTDDAIKQIIEEPIVKPVMEQTTASKAPVNEDVAEFDEPILSSNYLDYFSANPEIEAAYADIEKEVDNAISEISSVEVKKEETVPAAPAETVADNHAIENPSEFNTSMISEAINEAGEYNRINGEQTISELANNMVNEVRHPGETVKQEVKPLVSEEAKPVDIPFQNSVSPAPLNPVDFNDEDFSNTVSMEITKIMDEIASVEAVSDVKPEPVPEKVETVEEHPVLAKALQEEDAVEEVVEIKNLKDIESDPIKDTTSGTIPFVVAASDDEDVIEEDEEDGSNTILNVILIVLIVVLVAVLGLIIFYILKTRGII